MTTISDIKAEIFFDQKFELESIVVPMEVSGLSIRPWLDRAALETVLMHSFQSDAWNEPNRWYTFDGDNLVIVNTDDYVAEVYRPSLFHTPEPHNVYDTGQHDSRLRKALGITLITIHSFTKTEETAQ